MTTSRPVESIAILTLAAFFMAAPARAPAQARPDRSAVGVSAGSSVSDSSRTDTTMTSPAGIGLYLDGGAYLSTAAGRSIAPGVLGSAGVEFGTASGASMAGVFFVGRAGLYRVWSSAVTDDWMRYRGYSGLAAMAGAGTGIGPVTVSAMAGGILARYDQSYSYLLLPVLEPAVSLPVGTIARVLGIPLSLDLRVSATVVPGADSTAFSVRLGSVLRSGKRTR